MILLSQKIFGSNAAISLRRQKKTPANNFSGGNPGDGMGWQSFSAVKLAADVVTEPNWHLCEKDSRHLGRYSHSPFCIKGLETEWLDRVVLPLSWRGGSNRAESTFVWKEQSTGWDYKHTHTHTRRQRCCVIRHASFASGMPTCYLKSQTGAVWFSVNKSSRRNSPTLPTL